MDLHEIANSPGYGSGQKARDIAHEKANRRKQLPDPRKMNRLSADTSADGLVASLGNDGVDGEGYHLNADGYAAIGESSTAGEDARAIAAIWNAYMDGELVWQE